MLPVEKSPVEEEMEGGQQDRKQGGQIAWLTDMLEPALKLYKRALPAGIHAISLSSKTLSVNFLHVIRESVTEGFLYCNNGGSLFDDRERARAWFTGRHRC